MTEVGIAHASGIAFGAASVPAGPAISWLPQLAPAMGSRHLVHASSGGQFTRAVRAVGDAAAEWAVEVGQDVAERVAEAIPAHAAGGGFDVLRMGTEATVLQLLISLSGLELSTAMTAESLGGVSDFIQQRVGLDELLRGIQLGHSVIAAAFLDECARREVAETRHEQMRALSQRMFMFFDTFSTQMAAAYREEQARWVQSDAASRLAVVEEILQGHDGDVAALSSRLRHDLTRTHIGIIVWSSARTLDADQQELYESARRIVRSAGADQRLVLSISVGLVWAWITPKGDPTAVSRLLSAAALPPNTHAVFGAGSRGIPGFRASHADAAAAFAVRSLSPSPGAVTAYRDVDLISLLLADRQRAVRFAQSELGRLGRDDPQMRDLRETLAAYLDSGGSPQLAGQQLRVSRNTVSYRIRRAEELLGHPFASRRQHLQAALAILGEVGGEGAPPGFSAGG